MPGLSKKFRLSAFKPLPICTLAAVCAAASSAWASAPAVVIDAQQPLTTGFSNPTAITSNDTNRQAVFIADTNNNRVIAFVAYDNANYVLATGGFTLVKPQALALDTNGDLFVGDSPSAGVGRVIELLANNGNLTGAAQQVAGAPLTNPVSMAIDASGTLFIGDYSIAAGVGTIYSLAAGATTPPVPLPITGLPSADFYPGAMTRDSSANLYFADNGDSQGSNGGIYTVPTVGGAAQLIPTASFIPANPAGLKFSAAGDLYVLTAFAPNSGPTGQQVLIVPASSPSTPYVLPSNGIAEGGDLTFDIAGNLDVTDSINGRAIQLTYGTVANLGLTNVGQPGATVAFNVEFNAPTTLRGFSVITQGDKSTEVTLASGGTCANGAHNAATPNTPYTCLENYQGAAAYPGLRQSAILVKGVNGTIIATAPVFQTGFAGEEVTYPLQAVGTATGLKEPQGVAISGLNNTVYIADTAAGQVFSIKGLGGTGLTPVSTGAFTLQAPIALALDGAGNLFIADFNLGEVIEVPTATGLAPTMVIAPGGVVQHPLTLAIDSLGNLYVGDAGPAGFDASDANPGYIVKLPVGGVATRITIPTVPIVFPQALTTDYYTNNLYIGDGGDYSGPGQVVGVAADLSGAGVIPVPNVTNPSGLAEGPDGALYVLDGTANTITAYPLDAAQVQPYVLPISANTLTAASSMAISAGGQSFVVTDISSTNTLVYLNGNQSTLAFGSVPKGTQSQPLTAMEYNVGNLSLTLGNPYYSSNNQNPAFAILGSSTCGSNLTLNIGGSCSINVEFTPTANGKTTEQLNVNSTAYNTGVPRLTLQGTGANAGAVKKAKHQK